jgi:cellulose synthase operon protein YhjQ
MSVIGVVSMKGGVGKTTVTANLATALASKLGSGRVCVLDLDPQDALHWHFGTAERPAGGVCQDALHQASTDGQNDWRTLAESSSLGVLCLPYGEATEQQRRDFEELLADQTDWIGQHINDAELDNNAVVLIDTPPGPSVYLKQVFSCADLVLVILLADAGSYATVPAMEAWLKEMMAMYPKVSTRYVLNQVDRSIPINRDIADALSFHLGQRLCVIGIHHDDTVGEALAFQQPVLVYDPHGQPSNDFDRLATSVIDTLNQ